MHYSKVFVISVIALFLISCKSQSVESWVKEFILEPNPVEPGKALSIKVLTAVKVKVVRVVFKGINSWAGLGGWENDTVSLLIGGRDEWVAGTIAPDLKGIFPVTITLIDTKGKVHKFFKDIWGLKVLPLDFYKRPGFSTPEEAARSALKELIKSSVKIEDIKELSLLPQDRRDPFFHKFFAITFYVPNDLPEWNKGRHDISAYVLKDNVSAMWCLLSWGTGL